MRPKQGQTRPNINYPNLEEKYVQLLEIKQPKVIKMEQMTNCKKIYRAIIKVLTLLDLLLLELQKNEN